MNLPKCVCLMTCAAMTALAAVPGRAAPPEVALSDEARAIHAANPVIDGHNDLPWALRKKADASFTKLDLNRPQPQFHTDLARLKQGGVGAQFWSAYVPAESAKRGIAVTQTLEQIDVIHRMVAEYPNQLEFARTAADIERIRASGKIASLIGIEGGHSIDNSLGVLRTFHKLGVRYMTLTHSESLDWADSATDAPKANGLSPFGVEVVREMNRLGVAVDLSHVSVETMKAALKVTKAPVIFSHSSAKAVADHPRNVPDDVLTLVKENGGVVMVNFFSGFIVPEGARATQEMFKAGRELRKQYPDDKLFEEAMRAWVKDHDYPAGTAGTIADHIDRIVKVAGIDHAGIGSDYDGVGKLPAGMGDVSKYPYLTQELLNRGYKRADIEKVLGGNVLRVLKQIERAAGQ